MVQSNQKVWKRDDVDRIKLRIRDEVAPLTDLEQRLDFLLKQISANEENNLDRLLYIHASLHTHLRSGGLPENQVKELLQLAQALLTLHNIKPKTSSLAFLLGELHALQAQIHLTQGEALLASLEQQLVQHLSGPTPPGGEAFHNLSLAQYVLRLGEAELTIDYAERALREISDDRRHQAQLLKLRALRLSLQFEAAEEWSAEIQRESTDERWLRELAWESLCRDAFKQGSVDPLMQKLNPRHDFYHTSYVLEGFFWARATSSLQWLEHLPKLKSLGQKKQFNFKAYANFHRCATALEKSYDKEIPLTHRLVGIKKTVQMVQSIADIDKVLLVHLSLIRWLLRSQCRDFGRILWSEYSGLSLRLTRGLSQDVLGIAGDLTKKSWD